MDTVRVGIVGLYGIANRHYDEIAATPELDLGAVCDIDDTLELVGLARNEVQVLLDGEKARPAPVCKTKLS